MSYRALLIAATVLTAGPALAAVDPPAASTADRRIRTVAYSAINPVTLAVSPGASVRIQLGPDEQIEQISVSDQGGMGFDARDAPEPGVSNVSLNTGSSGPGVGGVKWPPSCDVNLCRTVVGNFVYLRPLRALEPQPLFIQTKRCSDAAGAAANCAAICPDSNIAAAGSGKCEMVPYTFELLTRPTDVKAAADTVAWSVSFTYPDRARTATLLEGQRRRAAQIAAWRERQANKVAGPAVPKAADNYFYGYRGSASLMPDNTWDDGRSTFMRFKGNRRLPIPERVLPDGSKSIPAYSPETDAGGTTLRIARTETKWRLRDGDEVGCVFNVGSDPDGRNAATVASSTPR